ncbi:cyanophycinase [Aurantiacibacter odishensis]|uniref:cyanophycinase n=1 Tax=Aurantiacibacter odishensis TaxID=1155476 RepID=UPI000E771C24|nr:cyanophycinase [Aurantiacibacter odishensis]
MLQTRLVALACAALVAACTVPQVRAEPGTLVIVGGGLEPDNAEIFAAFLEARPSSHPTIAIIPAASGEPARSAEAFREALIAHGADADAIEVVRLAVMDDPATADTDEARWAANVDNTEEIARVAEAGAIWFTGGDQSRITGLLLNTEGRDTPMLAAIRARLRDGAVIGGTSAGAAVMSDPMITQGDTLAALLPDTQAEPLQVGRGLGFVADMLVDQHFGERARLGRLAAALLREGQPHRRGAGIDENTALVLRTGSNTARVLGEGYVTFLDARMAELGVGERFGVTNLGISLATSGDALDLVTGGVTPAGFKSATVGNEYFATAPITGGGMALGATSLADVAGEALIDNSAARTVEWHSFSNGHGVTYRFTQTDASRGWWGRGPDGVARYALEKVRFDIEPIDVTIRRAGN